MSGFSELQVEKLLKPIKANRVYETQGHANLAAWDVKAHLIRMFGFGMFEQKILRLELLFETQREGTEERPVGGWDVCYGCDLRLTVRCDDGWFEWSNEDTATGDAQNQPSRAGAHDLARKNAVSYALKRCATALGDQFGLSLYNKGSKNPVVITTLVGRDTAEGSDLEHEGDVDGEGVDP